MFCGEVVCVDVGGVEGVRGGEGDGAAGLGAEQYRCEGCEVLVGAFSINYSEFISREKESKLTPRPPVMAPWALFTIGVMRISRSELVLPLVRSLLRREAGASSRSTVRRNAAASAIQEVMGPVPYLNHSRSGGSDSQGSRRY